MTAQPKVAELRRRWLPSIAWIFPLLMLVGVGYYAYLQYLDRGKEVTILYEEIRNVEVDKTKLMYRGLVVGKVSGLQLRDKFMKVAVQARFEKEYESLAREGSVFTLVQPKVGLQGIEGLETIVHGPYIQVEPGKGKPATEFTGNPLAPGAESDVASIAYYVKARHADALNVRDPVLFRGMQIGEVAAIDLANDGRAVNLTIKIKKDYVTLVRSNSKFWLNQGINADFSLFGSEVNISSLQSLLTGGIRLSTPSPAGKVANAEAHFKMTEEIPEDWRSWDTDLSYQISH